MRLIRKLAVHGTAIGLNQGLAFVAGILVVRALPQREYAAYAIAASILAAITLLSDSGVTGALLSYLGRAGGAEGRIVAGLEAALRFRARFSIGLLLVGGAWFLTFLLINDLLSPTLRLLAVVVLLVALIPSVSVSTYQVVLRSQGDLRSIRRSNLSASLSRLALVGVLVLIGTHSSVVFLVANATVAFLLVLHLRHQVRPYVTPRPAVLPEPPAFLGAMVRTAPTAASMLIAEQLLYAILSVRSTTEVIAEVAALSRFAVAMVVVEALVFDIGAPYLARLQRPEGGMVAAYGKVLALQAAASAAVVGLIAALAPLLTNLLGPAYRGLEFELVLSAVGAAAISLGRSFAHLNQATQTTSHGYLAPVLVLVWALTAVLIVPEFTITTACLLFGSQALPILAAESWRLLRSGGSRRARTA